MIKRRFILALAAAVTLSACAEPQLIDAQTSKGLSVNSVSVNVSDLGDVTGRNLVVAPEQIQKDVRAAVVSELAKGPNGSRDVNVLLTLEGTSLVSPAGALVPGNKSQIRGLLQVTDAETGETVLKPTKVKGTAKSGYALGGVIGAALKVGESPEQDYRATVAGFAIDVRNRLFGADK